MTGSTWVCECENPHRDLFQWRGDPDWWSCVQCDGRVRLMTDEERAELDGRPGREERK